MFITKPLQVIVFFPPIGNHFHEKLQKNLPIQELLNILTCVSSYFLDHTAALANNDILLRIALDNNFPADTRNVLLFFKCSNDDLGTVWNLLLVQFEHFFADDLRHKKPLILIRKGI